MIALVTDSTACLTSEDVKQLGAHVVPHTYTAGGKTYTEGCSGANGDFISLLRQSSDCVTEQCSMAAFQAAFEELLQKGYDVLCMVISSRLSGTYSSAQKAAAHLSSNKRYAGRIRVVDSQTTAGALRYLLTKARQLANEGLPLERLAQACEAFREKIGVIFSVGTMERLRKSGRFGAARQSINTILNRKPILLLKKGAIISWDMARGKTQQAVRLAAGISSGAKVITLHYFGSTQGLQPLLTAIRRRFSRIPVTFRELGPVLGVHVGTDTIAVSWKNEE